MLFYFYTKFNDLGKSQKISEAYLGLFSYLTNIYDGEQKYQNIIFLDGGFLRKLRLSVVNYFVKKNCVWNVTIYNSNINSNTLNLLFSFHITRFQKRIASPEAYVGLFQTSTMQLAGKNIQWFSQLLTIFTKN